MIILLIILAMAMLFISVIVISMMVIYKKRDIQELATDDKLMIIDTTAFDQFCHVIHCARPDGSLVHYRVEIDMSAMKGMNVHFGPGNQVWYCNCGQCPDCQESMAYIRNAIDDIIVDYAVDRTNRRCIYPYEPEKGTSETLNNLLATDVSAMGVEELALHLYNLTNAYQTDTV